MRHRQNIALNNRSQCRFLYDPWRNYLNFFRLDNMQEQENENNYSTVCRSFVIVD
jgi:hypothetical protein